MGGYTLNRQKPLGNYILDFYCKPLNLVIEMDDGYYFTAEQKIKDSERQKVLEGLKLNFLRFHDEEVKKDLPQVLTRIKTYIQEFTACQ